MKSTTAMKIAEEISTRIGNGVLQPGEHLVETVLAKEFNTSRSPIREALLMLERDRLVQRTPHHGVIVRRFTRKDIYELYDAIYRLEEISMKKAVANIHSNQIEQLKDILKEQEQAVENHDVQNYYDLNEDFHNLIFLICGNKILNDMYCSLRLAVRPFRMMSLKQKNNLHVSLIEHKKQVTALEKGDSVAGIHAIQEQEIRSLKSLNLLFPK